MANPFAQAAGKWVFTCETCGHVEKRKLKRAVVLAATQHERACSADALSAQVAKLRGEAGG